MGKKTILDFQASHEDILFPRIQIQVSCWQVLNLVLISLKLHHVNCLWMFYWMTLDVAEDSRYNSSRSSTNSLPCLVPLSLSCSAKLAWNEEGERMWKSSWIQYRNISASLPPLLAVEGITSDSIKFHIHMVEVCSLVVMSKAFCPVHPTYRSLNMFWTISSRCRFPEYLQHQKLLVLLSFNAKKKLTGYKGWCYVNIPDMDVFASEHMKCFFLFFANEMVCS